MAFLHTLPPSPEPETQTQMRTESLEANTRVFITSNKINSEEEGLPSGSLLPQAVVFTSVHLASMKHSLQAINHECTQQSAQGPSAHIPTH